MRISVITTCLNAAGTIRDTIESVQDSGYADLEHLIVDAGSVDGTSAIVHEYAHLLWHVCPGANIAQAWNFGISQARGDIVMLLNADDYLDPSTLTVAVRAFENAKRPCIVVGHVRQVDAALTPLRMFRGRKPGWNNLYRGLPFLHPSVLVSREIYGQVGPFDDRLRVAMDADWLVRAFALDVHFECSEHVVNMRQGGLSDSRMWTGFGEYLDSLARHGAGASVIVPALLNKAAVVAKRSLLHSRRDKGLQ